MAVWSNEAIIYHVFPLGMCGAPGLNNLTAEPVERLNRVYGLIDHIRDTGFNALMLGPVFESLTHGYDIIDYYNVDRRLGRNSTLKSLVETLHMNGIRVVLDAVFNHTGRDFHGFKDVLINGIESGYIEWFNRIDFCKQSPLGDPFDYDTWNGHYRFVKLDTEHYAVKDYIFNTVKFWIAEFDIDGLRLDCADSLDFGFMKGLASACKTEKKDFWLIGEVIHGDYSRWVNIGGMDSVTNYNCYKALYSSHNDRNYFEIAHTLRRQFHTETGLYKNIRLYNFADNHDVNRIASILINPVHVYPLHILLFTIPGIPSVYYGSEWGVKGVKGENDDPLRPELDYGTVFLLSPDTDLAFAVKKLIKIRNESCVLKDGDYLEIKVRHEQFIFARIYNGECVIVIVNSSADISYISVELPVAGSSVVDLLNEGETFYTDEKNTLKLHIYPNWGRILKVIP